MDREALKQRIRQIIEEMRRPHIPIGISNRHIHLSQADYDILFPREPIAIKKKLKQPGEFAAVQRVTLVGPKTELAGVRLLGPLRKQTQVEISATDARTLGVSAPVVLSGQLENACEITIKTEFAQIIRPCCIVAKRHIHVAADEAKTLGVVNGETVSVRIESDLRKTTYDDVIVRVSPNYVTEMHLDTDEGNAAGVNDNTIAYIVR